MTNITINERKRELVITKAFAKAASQFGSPEYLELREARRDFPNFKVVVRSQSKSKEETKGLTYEYMEKYIAKHDNDEQSIMEEFKMLRGLTEDGEEILAISCSYFEIKKWFLGTFPEIAEFHKKREEILKRVA